MLARCHQLARRRPSRDGTLNLPIGLLTEVTFRLEQRTSNDQSHQDGETLAEKRDEFPSCTRTESPRNLITIVPTSIYSPYLLRRERLIFSLGGKVAGRGICATG